MTKSTYKLSFSLGLHLPLKKLTCLHISFLKHMLNFLQIWCYLLFDLWTYFLFIILDYKNLKFKYLIDNIIIGFLWVFGLRVSWRFAASTFSAFFFFFSCAWTVTSHGFTVHALFSTVHVLFSTVHALFTY